MRTRPIKSKSRLSLKIKTNQTNNNIDIDITFTSSNHLSLSLSLSLSHQSHYHLISHFQEFVDGNSKENNGNDVADSSDTGATVGNGDDLNGVESDFEFSQICENGGKC